MSLLVHIISIISVKLFLLNCRISHCSSLFYYTLLKFEFIKRELDELPASFHLTLHYKYRLAVINIILSLIYETFNVNDVFVQDALLLFNNNLSFSLQKFACFFFYLVRLQGLKIKYLAHV